MSNTEDRLNRIIANHNESQQTASNRLDRVISNYSSRITNTPSQLQRRNMSTVQRLNAKVNNMMSNNSDILAEIRRRQEEQRRLKEIQDKQKQEEMRQLNNKIKNLSDEEKNAISNQVQKQNMQLKAYNADNVSKDLGVSKEEAEKLVKKSNSLPSKIKQAYTNSYGENGFAGVNAMANEIKKTPEVLQKIKETSAESPTLMGLRGSMAGTVDAGTSEIASLFETPEEEKWYEKNVIARQAKTYKRVFDKAQRISQNGGNALDVIWGAGSTLATGTVKNAMDILPANQMSNKIKKSTQAVLGNTLDEDTRKQVQKTMLGLTDSYYQDRAKYQENESKKSQTQQYIDTVLEGTSRMGGSIATTYVTGNPNMGLIATGLSAKGSATQEALREGATLEQAIDIGNLSGLVEMATEKIWSGIKLPGGKSLYGNSLGDAVENYILGKLKTKGGQWLASKGMDIAGEIAEEFISDTLESVAKQGIYDDNAKLPTAKDYWNTATTTAGTTILLNLLTGGFLQTPNINNQNITANQNTELQEQVQEKNNPHVNEQQTAFYDNKAKYGIDLTENTVKNKSYTLEELDNDFADTLNGVETSDGNVIYGYFDENNNLVIEKVKEDAFTSETLDSVTVKQKDGKFSGKDVNNAIKKLTEVTDEAKPIDGQIDIENNVQNPIKNQNINQQQQITQTENKNVLNQNVESQSETKFSKILNNQKLPMQSYVYEKSDNLKVDSLRQQANKYFNNSPEAHNFVNMLEKIITDKNIAINFDTNMAKDVNGYYNNGVITINPNSSRAGEFLAIHELTHAIGTDSMIKMVDNYRKSNAEFDSQVQKLLQKYNKSEVSEEALADIAGQLFGNQEYINNLSKTNPSIFKRIYNEIKYLWHQFRGYKNQDQFVDDLMFKWEQAYRSNNQLNNTVNYHISENFSNEIDKSLRGEITSNNQIKARDYTPKILVDNGVQDLPMLLTQKHLRQIIYTKQEAEKLGYRISKNDHYHGLGKETLLQAIDSMDNPSEIYKQSDSNYLIITELKDKKNNQIIIPIKINGTGTYNDVRILENQILSLYGRERLNKYLADNNFTKIYEKNRSKLNGEGVKSHDSISASNNSITPSNENVNTTKYSMQESENNSVNLPKTDNKGNILSKQQQEYFKDSKVRDENGKLLEVYHGTEANVGIPQEHWFTIFDRDKAGSHGAYLGAGFYFTANKESAQSYAKDKGNVVVAYLKITNPYTQTQDIINKDGTVTFAPGFYEDFENRFKNQLPSDWGEINNYQKARAVRNILEDNGYDGVISGDTYVAFESNQIKNVNNQNPTSNPDIRYSKSEDTSNKTLLAMHNLSEDKLKGILELDGFPVPSIAITNPDIVSHDQFGDITVVFDKDTIDPSNSQNEVYDRDVWSPTFPQVDYVINQDAIDTVSKNIGIEWWRLNDYAEDSKPDYLIEKLARNEDVIDKYIKDNNLKYEVAYKEPSFKRSYNNTEEMKKWANKNNPTLEELSTNQKLKEEYLKLTQLDKNSELYETLDSSLDWYSKDHIKNPWLTQLENDLNILTGKAEIQPEIDEYTTRDNKERVAKQNGLEEYLKENIKDIYGERGIRNDRDIFTPSGNRRSFWQLHDEYNLENIVRNLVSQDTTGSESSLFTGFGKINAQMSNKFNSIEDIKNNQNRLMQDTENNNLEAYKETILEDVNELADYYKYPDSGFGMQGYENASESIFELAKSKKLTAENFKKILTENVMNTEKIPDSLLNKVIDDLDNLKNLPTDYFEAKPQRAVGLDEVRAIVVPSDMNQELKQQLIDRGLNVVEYDANKEGDRQAKIKALDEYKFSKNNGTWQEYLEKEFPAKGTRTNMQNIKRGVLPTKETINQKKEQNKSDIKLPPKVSANNQYKDTTTKVRKHYKSIIESANTTPEAKAIAKKLMGTDTYIPETNKSELERADEKIMNSTPESELNSLMSRATVGEKITPVDIAVGERLIEYYSKTGDKAKLQDAIQATAMAGTTAGQTVQAMSLLNHMTPQGQAVWLQRSVDKMNNKLKKTRGKNAQQFTLTDDMLQKIVSSENEEQLAKNLDEVYQELGQQVSKSTMEKIDAWRYFSMLANPRTHIRNIGGNVAMGKVQTGKNKVAGVIEATVAKFNPNMERTHTIVPASKEVRQFAKNDIKNVTDRLGLTEGKLNPQTRLENNMKTFKHDAMNKTVGKLFDLNNKALEVEDGWGLKAGYVKALAEYMTANKLKPDTITDAQLSKARNYAVQQAKEATFHQENQLASLVNQLSNRNRFAKFGVDAVLPFKKTPMNIAKTGIEYSPVGLAKSMVLDTVQLRKGNITVNQYIDNISKGLTGTGIALVGYALAQAGILKASGGDDDKEKYEEGRGKQAFSIQIGDNTYSLDWLAPTAIPLFIGAEISALNRATNEAKTSNSSDEDSKYNQLLKSTTNVLDAFTNSMNPMMEMSMLSGLASTLRSYEQGATQGITAMGTNALKSYVNQFFPTAMGQVAKTMDPYERSTTSTKSGMLPKAVDSTKNQIMAKVPGLRQMLPTKTDVWGNEMKQPENVVQRALENAVLPYTRKEVNNNDVDQELVRLYEERGEKAVLPSSSLSKDLTFSGEKYKMTSEEFAKYKKDYGSKSYSLINDLVNSSDYNRLSDEDKQQALENVYKYAKEYAKDQYAEANDIDYKKDTMFKTAQEMEKSGNVSSYFNYLAKTDGMKEKEKMNVLVKASYENNDKKLIYTNTIGSDDKLYNDAMKYTGININEYLKYKQQEFTSDKTDDGTVNGKSVSGSKKAKVYDYVNKMKITGEQRMLLLGTQYKLTNEERATLANYVKNLKITKNQKLEIYKKLQGFTVYKDGRVTY